MSCFPVRSPIYRCPIIFGYLGPQGSYLSFLYISLHFQCLSARANVLVAVCTVTQSPRRRGARTPRRAMIFDINAWHHIAPFTPNQSIASIRCYLLFLFLSITSEPRPKSRDAFLHGGIAVSSRSYAFGKAEASLIAAYPWILRRNSIVIWPRRRHRIGLYFLVVLLPNARDPECSYGSSSWYSIRITCVIVLITS